MKSIILYFIIFLLTVSACKFNREHKDKPNILFIAVDDMNDWIGPLGGLKIAKTPNLDRLARESMVFTNAHCASPACAPSRLAIMTGVQPSKTGIMQNVWFDGPEWREIPILRKIETIEQFFINRGYKTLGGGKIYHTLAPPWLIKNQADPECWDFYFPSIHVPLPFQVRAKDNIIFPDHFTGKRHPYFTWGPLDVPDEKMCDYQVVDWARYVLSQEHDKPFFLACGIFRPHMPWEVPQEYFDLYPLEDIPNLTIKENDLEDGFIHDRREWHKFVLHNHQWKNVIQAYLASISFADAQIGRLLDGLSNSQYHNNTIVVLWSDHGMHMGEKENWEKFTLWEESTRVPLIFKIPGKMQIVGTCNQPVSLLDIYPTLVELANFEVPEHCDGQSLLPQLKNGDAIRNQSALTSYEFGGKHKITGHSLRNGEYRYIYYSNIHLEELYNHNDDPNEFVNLAYDENYMNVINKFRHELVKRVNGISLDQIETAPQGYILKKDRIRKNGFIPIQEIEIEK